MSYPQWDQPQGNPEPYPQQAQYPGQLPHGVAQPTQQFPSQPQSAPPQRPWFKKKRFAIPGGILALAIVGAAVTPKDDADSPSAAATSSAPVVDSSPAPIAPVEDVPATPPAPASTPAPAPVAPPEPDLTMSQENAQESAESYLDFAAFSRSGLINQLEFEGFSNADAAWAVDSLDVDWNQEAAESAESYLEFTSFSRSGLIEQLEFEGFTPEQAEYGVSQAGF